MLSSPNRMLSDGSESYGINMSIVSIQLNKEDLDFITSEPDFGTEVSNTFISIRGGAILF